MFIPSRDLGGYDKFKDAPPLHWKTAVSLRGKLNAHTDNGGWSVEGRIPWSDLAPTGGRPAPGETWRFALCRVDYTNATTSELSTIAPLTKRSFHRHEDYAPLRFAPPSGPKPFGLDHRTPWTNSHLVGSPDPAPPYAIEKAFPNLKIFQPCYVIEDPGSDDLLVIQHLGPWAGPGKIIRITNDSTTASEQTIFEAQELIYSLCFHPDYARNGYLYIYSNGPLTGEHHFNHVTRYTMDRKTGIPDLASKQLVIEEWESNGHNGGGIDFGPDGMLYFTTGDTSNDSDRADRGQDLRYLSAAMIRIDVDHPDPGKNYGVPKDNPFINVEGVRPEIWAHGFRNPWRMCFDKKTGALWVGQNGQDLWEPVYVVQKGANYGWPVYEGSHPFHPQRKLETRTKLMMPTIEHHHSEARSITGGVVYHGTKFPDLAGAYIYGDFSTGRIWAAWYDGAKVTAHKLIARTTAQITNFYADKNGDLFICDDAGGIFKLVPALPSTTVTAPFPRLLSQTGLFTDTAKHQPDPALIPYDVNSPLWSDNAKKQRFIALPTDTQIDHMPAHGWNFPEGGALVKTFSLGMEAGNPASARRLETRVMLKQGGQWAGYTYLWNDAQTDAELAPAAGVDQTYTIKDPVAPNGQRQQTWHYPSRAECLVCHSRAANFVLGLSDLQMNRDFDYGNGRTDNQLRTLEHLGVLRTDYPALLRERLRKESHGLSDEQLAKLTDTTGQRELAKSTLLMKPPQQLPHLADPADTAQSLDVRARSYLHANCAHCHVEAGGGNASVDLDFATVPSNTKMFDQPAQSNLLALPDAKLIATAHPEKSILLHRVATRGTGQMPPIGSNLVDERGAKLLEEWIRKMPASTQPAQ
jgi:glucose/arabinose dehydrogenase/mono/diheme cytochrome c family protein